MGLKILLLLVIVFICLFPILYDPKPTPKRKSAYKSWKGPKTDERINKMLAECSELMKELGVPISENICPEVTLTGSHCSYGRCCRKGSLKKYTKYDFYIEISGLTLGNTEKSLRNTLIHELLHTIPNAHYHKKK